MIIKNYLRSSVGVVMKKIIAFTFIFSLLTVQVQALSQPYPETFSVNSNVTCPSLYPIKTGSSSGGVYTTTCFSQKAWDLYMAGGDDWQAWINGTYSEPPVPTPTVTVTPPAIIRNNTVTVERIVLEPCPAITKPKAIRAEIKKMQRELQNQQRQREIKREIKRLKRQLNA
jgi:hypothetical protein